MAVASSRPHAPAFLSFGLRGCHSSASTSCCGFVARRHQWIQRERIDQFVAIAGQRGLHRGALVALHPFDQVARVIGDGPTICGARAVLVDAARDFDDVVVVEEGERAVVGDVERDDGALVVDDRAHGHQRDAIVAGQLSPVRLDARLALASFESHVAAIASSEILLITFGERWL